MKKQMQAAQVMGLHSKHTENKIHASNKKPTNNKISKINDQ
jgi:hypothetical protein